MRTLTKADIAKTVCDQTGMRQMDAKKLLNIMLDIMKDSLRNEHEVLLSSFGKFEVFTKKERKGRNPHTDEVITLDAHKVLAFRLSRKFKADLNNARHKEL